MASTGKTKNLGLCQWEATDPFLREDMNGDFAKIDEAVSRKSEFTHIKTVVVPQGTEKQINVDVSDIDFSQWQYVMIDVSVSPRCKVLVNNYTGWNWCNDMTATGQTQTEYIAMASSGTRLTFSPHGTGGRVTVLAHTKNAMYFGYCEQDYSQMKSVNFVLDSNQSFSGSSEFVIWGIR